MTTVECLIRLYGRDFVGAAILDKIISETPDHYHTKSGYTVRKLDHSLVGVNGDCVTNPKKVREHLSRIKRRNP